MFELNDFVQFFQQYGVVAVFVILLLCGLGLPLPEDIVLTAGGVLSGLNIVSLKWMLIICFLGVLIGDLIMFTLGRQLGKRIFEWSIFRRIIPQDKYDVALEKFARNKYWALFAARFMPGLRALMFVVAGVTNRVSYPEFIAVDGTAALISVPVWVLLGHWGADNLEQLLDLIKKGKKGLLILFLIALSIFVSYLLIKKFFFKRGKKTS